MQDACTDSSGKNDCLWRVTCNITGASCPKMDALFKKLDTEKETKNMTNTAKNTAAATPKDVKEKVEEKTVPAQATAPENAKTDKVVDNAGKTLFSGTPAEVKAWLLEQPTMVYAVRQASNNDLVLSTVYVEAGPLKLTLVQRAKAAAEKLKKNKRSQLLLAGAVVCAGIAVKNARYNRKAADAEPLDEVEGPVVGVEPVDPDETTDSL